jgi:hypothetical protein
MEHLSRIYLVLVLSLVSLPCCVRLIADVFRNLGDDLNNFRGGGRGGPSHPLPVTSPVETSRGSANPKD